MSKVVHKRVKIKLNAALSRKLYLFVFFYRVLLQLLMVYKKTRDTDAASLSIRWPLMCAAHAITFQKSLVKK